MGGKSPRSQNFTSKITEQSKTNKTIENQRADAKLRQDIDDFDNFNNSEEDEKIDILDEDFESGRNGKSNEMMPFIDEEDEFKEEMRQVQEAYELKKAEGQRLQNDFENNAGRSNTGGFVLPMDDDEDGDQPALPHGHVSVKQSLSKKQTLVQSRAQPKIQPEREGSELIVLKTPYDMQL